MTCLKDQLGEGEKKQGGPANFRYELLGPSKVK
jgi:hypothetical protein